MAEVNKRILLECTGSYKTELNTGIQRVVRNIVEESKNIGKDLEIQCQAVISKHGSFWTANRIVRYKGFWANFRTHSKKIYIKFCSFIYAIFPFRWVERFLFPSPNHFGLFSILKAFLLIASLPTLPIFYLRGRVISQKGDILLLLDSSWVYPIWPAVKRAKAEGAVVGLVIYDIFQITQPNFFTPPTVERFQIWLDQAATNVDFFIAISKTTQDEVKKYLESHHPAVNWSGRLESFQLGSVIDNPAKGEEVRDTVKKVFEKSDKPNTYLTVGTIEPRKNHGYLLDAFDKVWLKSPNAYLCIVGRVGRESDSFMARLKSHPHYGTRLFMFDDLSDTELGYCYSYAKALLFPSHAEGFGLPIIEALNHGLPVFASNIPIHREVGKTFCSYFDIGDSNSLAKTIIDIETTGKMPEVQNPKEYKLPTWKDSCRELLTKAVALSGKIHYA